MTVEDRVGRVGAGPREGDRRQAASEHVLFVVTDSDRPIECWIEGREGTTHGDVVVVDPERGAELGFALEGNAVVVSPDPGDGEDSRCERLETPLDRETLSETIDRLDRRARYDDVLAEYARLAARRGKREAEIEAAELDDDREYRALRRRLAGVEDELDRLTRSFDGADFRAAFESGGFGGARKRAD